MSISFDNGDNCLNIARTPGMIQVLLEGLNEGSDESRDGASGVLCNVIYYNKEAARLVLGCDNVLSMLNGLCKSRDMWSKYLGVSVLEACCHQENAVRRRAAPVSRQPKALPHPFALAHALIVTHVRALVVFCGRTGTSFTASKSRRRPQGSYGLSRRRRARNGPFSNAHHAVSGHDGDCSPG